jgi:hypothetical protein
MTPTLAFNRFRSWGVHTYKYVDTAIPTSNAIFESAPGRIRTCDTRFRKPVLYPLSYEGGACRKAGRKLRLPAHIPPSV